MSTPDLGIPGAMAPACEHVAPTFGCLGCISKDREAFARKAYAAWKRAFRLPRCAECKTPMRHDDLVFDSKQVRAVIVCPRLDASGEPCCWDAEQFVVIA